jgi:hypothetical protein
MRSRLMIVPLLAGVLALATFAARPPAPSSDSAVAVQTVQPETVTIAHDSLPALSFRAGDVDSVLSIRATLASHPTPAPDGAHDAAFDSAVARSFVPVTFNARPRHSRIIIPLRRSPRDSLGNPG